MQIEYILRVIDFETTGIPDSDTNHSVVEYAYIDISAENKFIKQRSQSLVAPSTPMDIQALAVHHIKEKEALDNGLSWCEAEAILLNKTDNQEIVYVAHNAPFEQEFFNPEQVKWIDTYKVALVLYPEAPGHSNQVLKYFLGIEDQPKHHPPHRALPDCEVTTEILLRMSQEMSFNEMIKVSKEPPFLTKISFGKHKGEKFEDIPKDYLQWLVNQSDMDAGVIAAAHRHLN
tara:strand:- start:1832 stop:2524 length:693 start_codon:yes stop_codon:yes gene_type:complete